MRKKILLSLFLILLVLVISGLFVLRQLGHWNQVFPSSQHDTVPPDIPSDLTQGAILVFTKTNNFRHIDAIETGVGVLEEIAHKRGWGFFHTENGAIFNDTDLSGFSAVVFHNANGDMLSEEQESAFQRWLESGGGWLGIHSAGDGSHSKWRWYTETLIGANYTWHIMFPRFQTATINIEESRHPATWGLPRTWEHEEEWYSWDKSPRDNGFRILATVDEGSYNPEFNFFVGQIDLRMGDHPVVWSRCVKNGRALYSALGHKAESYENPEHQLLLEGALAWVVGEEGIACEGDN